MRGQIVIQHLKSTFNNNYYKIGTIICTDSPKVSSLWRYKEPPHALAVVCTYSYPEQPHVVAETREYLQTSSEYDHINSIPEYIQHMYYHHTHTHTLTHSEK